MRRFSLGMIVGLAGLTLALALPCPVGDLGFVGEHGQRRLQGVRQIARLRDRPLHGLIAQIQQRVEIVHHRLHFARIVAFDSLVSPIAHQRETGAKMPESERLTAG